MGLMKNRIISIKMKSSVKNFFMEAIRKGPRKKKDPRKSYTINVTISFSPEQIEFLEKQSEIDGTTKSSIVRKCLNLYIVKVQKENDKSY